MAVSDFQLAQDGLAAALKQVPTSGPTVYRISVVKFDGSVETVVPPTTIDSDAALEGVILAVEGMSQGGGNTAIGDAIAVLTDNFENDGGLGDTTIFNVTTDGSNNTGISVQDGADIAAAAGVDSLSYEAVGFGADTTTLVNTAFPGNPVLIDDAADIPDDITDTSFVLEVDSFDDYAGALNAKVGAIIDDTGGGTPDPAPIPLPASMPLLLAGLGAIGFMRRRARA